MDATIREKENKRSGEEINIKGGKIKPNLTRLVGENARGVIFIFVDM